MQITIKFLQFRNKQHIRKGFWH